MKLTQRELKKILKYDRETGEFFWKNGKKGGGNLNKIAGCLCGDNYVRISINGKLYLAHRLAFLYIDGYLPENHVDHINRIRNDNRRENLREASYSCQMRNRTINKNNKSGITGISFDKKSNGWRANIMNNKKQIVLGIFQTLKEAAQARYNAEVNFGYPNCDIKSTAKKYLDSLS